MSEDTTTTTEQEPVQAEQNPQPENLETQAVQVAEKATDTTEISEAEPTAEPTEATDNSEILEWASKKGVKTDDPIAILKMARESEQAMHKATVKANALRDTVQTIGTNEGYEESVNLLNRLKVTDFYLNNPEAKSLDAEMAQIVNEKPYLAEDLDTVFELASSRTSKKISQAQVEVNRKEKLAQVTKAEIAAPPQTSATTRETPHSINDDDIAKMTLAEYKEWKQSVGNPFQIN